MFYKLITLNKYLYQFQFLTAELSCLHLGNFQKNKHLLCIISQHRANKCNCNVHTLITECL